MNNEKSQSERVAVMESDLKHLEQSVHELFGIVQNLQATSANFLELAALNQQSVKHEATKVNEMLPKLATLWDMRSQFKGSWSSATTAGIFILGFINTIGVLVAIFHK